MQESVHVRRAATFPDRVGADASSHGGDLVTDKPDTRICSLPTSAPVLA